MLGFKPTFGLIPVEGVFPFAPSFDCVGFFASSIDLIEQAFIATADEEPAAAQDVSAVDVTALKAKGERFADLLAALEHSDFELTESVDLEDTIAATAELYEPMRLKEVYDVHRPLLDQRDKYQDVILQRVLGGENISQEDYDAAAQGVKELREKALALLGDAPLAACSLPASRSSWPPRASLAAAIIVGMPSAISCSTSSTRLSICASISSREAPSTRILSSSCWRSSLRSNTGDTVNDRACMVYASWLPSRSTISPRRAGSV